MGWKKRVRTKSFGQKVFLETMGKSKKGNWDYWIIPMKFSIDVMEQMMRGSEIDIGLDRDELKDKTTEEIEQLFLSKMNSTKGKKMGLDLNSIKMSFLHGVKDHNFDDENGKKIEWDEKLFEELKEYPDTLLEIFKKVMRFNYPLDRKKSGK